MIEIPAEAVEAGAKALDPQTMGSGGALAEKFQEATRAEARRILEAAAPILMAQAWDEGWDSGFDYGHWSRDPRDPAAPNPYREADS